MSDEKTIEVEGFDGEKIVVSAPVDKRDLMPTGRRRKSSGVCPNCGKNLRAVYLADPIGGEGKQFDFRFCPAEEKFFKMKVEYSEVK